MFLGECFLGQYWSHYVLKSKVWRNSQTQVWQQRTGAGSGREEGYQENKCCKILRHQCIWSKTVHQIILKENFLKSYNKYLQEICQCYGLSPPVTEWWQQWHLCFPPLGGRGPPHPVAERGPGTESFLASAIVPSDDSFQTKLGIIIYTCSWKKYTTKNQSCAW